MTHRSLADRVRLGEDLPLLVGGLLSACTPVVRVGMLLRRMRKAESLDACVISFGNLTAGGTGKTPAVIERALRETAQGRRVAVLTRGYGADKSSQPVAARQEDVGPDLAARIGDEPALIVQKVSGVVVVRHPDRVTAGRLAMERFGCDTLILDDGYQYLRLERDENILLVDATNPFGNGHLVPRGILREPLAAIGRADQIFLTRCDMAADLPVVLERVRALAPETPIRTTYHAPEALRNLQTNECYPLNFLQGKAVDVACAVGNPESFRATVEALGAEITSFRAYPDHAPIPVERLPRSECVLVTEKDGVRMASPPANVYALAIALRDFPVS